MVNPELGSHMRKSKEVDWYVSLLLHSFALLFKINMLNAVLQRVEQSGDWNCSVKYIMIYKALLEKKE